MLDTLNQIIEDGHERKLVHNYTEDEAFGNLGNVTIAGKELINFGSCSYLGLENDEVLKKGAIEATMKYGTQFSSSRTYLSIGLYKDLEDRLYQVFEKPLLVSASTTLGHLATIPTIVGENDAVILDLQVHSSIQMTVQLLKAKKIPVYIIRHNDMEALEKKIRNLNNKYERIWYFADGVYSMYGDYAPFGELNRLLDTYKKFHLYIDDAHGMSWMGEKGKGVVRSHMEHHERMVLAVSLNKSFAAAGGCIVFPNKEMEQRVRNCGSTYIFCGPIQPPMLGAACASADLHLSDAIRTKQEELKSLIDFTNHQLDALQLPQYMKTDSPLFFIPVGLPKLTYDIIQKMKADGFYLNTASFPAVPMKKSGIRFMINNKLGKAEIQSMLEKLQQHYIETLLEAGSSCEHVSKVFRIPAFQITIPETNVSDASDAELVYEVCHTIQDCDKKEWNAYFLNNGNLDYDHIRMLEETFRDNPKSENNWEFHYITIKDKKDEVVLKTFYTVALVKDDMLSPDHISRKLEHHRSIENPYYLTSKTVVSGSLITKGNQVHINYHHENWKKALGILMDKMNQTMANSRATNMMLRDFIGKQKPDFEKTMLEMGLTHMRLPNNLFINDLQWDSTETFLRGLNQKYRYNVRKEILRFEDRFIVEYKKPKSDDELKKHYELYESVFDKSFELNVFKLPFKYFKAMSQHPNYDFIQLYLKPEFTDGTEPTLVATMYSYINDGLYNAMIVGLDYEYVYTHNTYKQILYQTLKRARSLGAKALDLAFTAELEKKKLGARPREVYAYVQTAEHYQNSVLMAL